MPNLFPSLKTRAMLAVLVVVGPDLGPSSAPVARDGSSGRSHDGLLSIEERMVSSMER